MSTYTKDIKEIISISVPMIIGNLGHVLTGATDVLVAAKHSVNTLAAIAISNSILFTVFILGLGFLTGISILLSNYRGEQKPTKKYLFSGIILSVILAFLTWIATVIITLFIPSFNFEKQLVPIIQEYMFITSFSLIGMFIYQGIKEFLQAHEIVKFPNIILLLSVILNLILNYIFVFGFGFIQPMGAAGLAIATLIVRTLLCIAMIMYVQNIIIKQYKKQYCDFSYMKKIIKIGFPIGIGLLFEFLAYNIITIYIGREAGVLAATQNILLTIIDITFMIPLAISSAIAIKVGYYNGAKNIKEIKKFGFIGISMTTIFMLICSILFIIIPEFFIGIFTKDTRIIEIALPVVSLFAISEFADGIQISLGGILKGLKMTKQTTACTLSSYWFIGLPLGFYLYCSKEMSLKGFWIGLATALFCIAVLESIIIIQKLRKQRNEY